MKKRQIQWIIALMTFALVGLVTFQLYWINHAIAVKNEQFNRSVQEALQAVVLKLERQEAMHTLAKRLHQPEQPAAPQTITITNDIPQEKPAPVEKANKKGEKKKPVKEKKQTQVKTHAAPQEEAIWQNNFFSGITDTSFALSLSSKNLTDQVQQFGFEFNSADPGQFIFFFADSIRQALDSLQLLYTDDQLRVALPNRTIDRMINEPANKTIRQKEKTEQKKAEKEKSTTSAYSFQETNTPSYFNEIFIPENLFNQPAVSLYDMPGVSSQWQKQMEESLAKVMHSKKLMQNWQQKHDSLLKAFAAYRVHPDIQSGNPANAAIRSETKKPVLRAEAVAQENDTIQLNKANLKDGLEKVQKKSEIVADVFKELIRTEQPIHERVNKEMIDTLLKKEIRNQHITIPYEYGVQSSQNKIILASTSQLAALPQSVFKTTLFPNDVFCANDALFIHFPTQQQFIMEKMWTVLAGSAVLILVVICCFYTAIATILKQKKLSEIKNDFINNMTHEFKTPISTISLACEVLQDNEVAKDPSHMSRYLHIIRDESKRLGLQVEKVLQSAMLEKGDIKLKLTKVDIHQVIDEVLQNIGVQIEKRQGTVQLDLQAQRTIIEADEVHLTNIIHNLLDNANKYSPEAPQIQIKTRSLSDGVSIAVTDKGIGMSKEVTQRIFDKFYRVPTGNIHNVKGFGLGLSYVKTVLQGHRGKIQVDSQLNTGSAFEIFLPYIQRA